MSDKKASSGLAVKPFPALQVRAAVPLDQAASGLPIPAIDRIRLFSSEQWEDFVQEWADSLRGQYREIVKCAGAGDKGRDVIAIDRDDADVWDNYQCKHYDHRLQPGDVWLELGKLVYYTDRKDYTYPRRYYFVAPQGAGTTLSNLLTRPKDLRDQFVAKWDDKCRSAITKEPIEMDQRLRSYVESLDFGIFSAVQPLTLVSGHAMTRHHVARFGGGLPARPPVPDPPVEPGEEEANYVRCLLDAYADHLKRPIASHAETVTASPLNEHFSDSRLEFYSAEALRGFSRDTLPPGEFGRLQDDIHHGIRDEVRADHADAYRRVVAVVKTARATQLAGHALSGRMAVRDYGGICHQLANDGKVRWTR